MTATDELRHLLDERGVKHIDYGGEGYEDDVGTPTTWWYNDQGECTAVERDDDRLTVEFKATPAQAIAATLGAGTCRLVETEHEQEIAREFGDGYFTYWSYDCDECGHENTEYGRFCAGCGRKVVNE